MYVYVPSYAIFYSNVFKIEWRKHFTAERQSMGESSIFLCVLSLCLLCMTLCLSLSTVLSRCPSTCLSICLFRYLFACLSVGLSLNVLQCDVPPLSQQEALRRVMAVARKLALPIFLADPTALSLIGQTGGSAGLGRGCSFLCTGRPVTAFAAIADHWKYDVSGLSLNLVNNHTQYYYYF